MTIFGVLFVCVRVVDEFSEPPFLPALDIRTPNDEPAHENSAAELLQIA